MSKKIFRVLGYIFCGLLICLCILLVVASSMFGAQKTVDVFGANIFVVDNDDIPSAPKGSAVLVKKGSCADLEEGKLVLYTKADAGNTPTLGYVRGLEARDGVYYLTVSYKDSTYEFPESMLIGRADYSSKFWGGVIEFIKTPVGIMLVAVLPCAALILYDIIRAAAANRPEPEVVPIVKNADEEPPHTDIKLSVDTEGKALYAKDRSLKPLPQDNDVLFNYSGKQKSIKPEIPKKEIPRNERPIIPLTDKKPQPDAPKADAGKTGEKTGPEKTGKVFDVKIPADDQLLSESVTAPVERPSDKTAELPVMNSTKPNRDAFFAQPSAGRQAAPQIGAQRRRTPPNQPNRLDEPDEEPAPTARPKPEKTAGKRSTQILASKSFDDLLSDDDDVSYPQNKRNKAIDDILSGFDRRK